MLTDLRAMDVLSPTQQLRGIYFNGKIELDCASDGVFVTLFELIDDASRGNSFIDSQGNRVEAPKLFFAWDKATSVQHKNSSRLVLERPSLWELVNNVCQIRKRRILDMDYGLVLLSKNANIKKLSTVVKSGNSSEKMMESLQLFLPQKIRLIDVSNNGNGIIAYLNEQLKITSKIAHFPKTVAIRINEAAQSGTSSAKNGRKATFLGYWRYLDMLHVYGGVFREEFIIGNFEITMQPVQTRGN